MRPVAYLATETGSGQGTMVTRLTDGTETAFSLEDIDRLSIASEHLPGDRVSRSGWTIGDPVRHPDFGFGVVQSFAGHGDDTQVRVRFSEAGERPRVLQRTLLQRLGLSRSGVPITGAAGR